MSDDLVKRARHNALSDMPHYASVELIEALADRIEELEDKLNWVIVERDETFALMLDRAQTAEAKLAKANDRRQGLEELLWAAEKDANEAEAYAGELEAKLEKAVEALEKIDVGEGWAAQIARTTLAELTGGKDE